MFKKMKLTLIAPLFFILLSSPLMAGPFTVTCTSGCNAATLAAFDELETQINNDLPDTDQGSYLEGMSNASVFGMKGNGTDYANEIDLFVVGVTAGAGFDVGDSSFSDLVGGDVEAKQIRGVSISPSLMVGVNMGMFDLPSWEYFDPNKIKLMVNFFTMDLGTFGDEISGDTTNLGVHARYKIYDEYNLLPGNLFRWTGIDFTTGIEYNTLDLTYVQTKTESYTVGSETATIDGTLTAGADVSTTSIPLEVSTGLQMGYVVTTYVGLGADLNAGSASSIAEVNADISADTGSGTGNMDLGDEGGPSSFLTRAFAGIQFNIPLVRIFAQIDKGLGEDLYAANAGLRITW